MQTNGRQIQQQTPRPVTKSPEAAVAPAVTHKFLCQGCGSPRIRRAHRVGFKDSLFSLVGRFPYHCHHCQLRSMLPSKSLPESTDPTATPYPRAKVRQERKKSELRRLKLRVLLFAICAVLFAVFATLFILRVPSGE